jgi:hypothetical protein
MCELHLQIEWHAVDRRILAKDPKGAPMALTAENTQHAALVAIVTFMLGLQR